MIDSNSIKRSFNYINNLMSEMAEPGAQLAKQFISKLFSWNGGSTTSYAYSLGIGALTVLFPCTRQRIINSLPNAFSANHAYGPADSSLQEKVNKICEELGLPKVLVLVYDNPETVCSAFGTRIAGPSVLYVDRNVLRNFENNEFLIRHELAHIAHNDSLFKVLIHNGTLLCGSMLYDRVIGAPQSCSARLVKGVVCDLFASALSLLYSRHAEYRADQTAILSASHNRCEIAQQGVQFFENLRSCNQYFRRLKGLWGALCMTKKGENRLDFEHPSLRFRIEQLEQYQAN